MIEVLSQADEQARRMFDSIWESIEYRICFEDRLLAANLANQKLNEVLDHIGAFIETVKNLVQAEHVNTLVEVFTNFSQSEQLQKNVDAVQKFTEAKDIATVIEATQKYMEKNEYANMVKAAHDLATVKNDLSAAINDSETFMAQSEATIEAHKQELTAQEQSEA